MILEAAIIEGVTALCNAADGSGFAAIGGSGAYMCPLFRGGYAADPVFIRSPSGGGGLTQSDAFDCCACNVASNLGRCTTDLATRNQCYFDPLISSGGASFASDVRVDLVHTAQEVPRWLLSRT